MPKCPEKNQSGVFVEGKGNSINPYMTELGASEVTVMS